MWRGGGCAGAGASEVERLSESGKPSAAGTAPAVSRAPLSPDFVQTSEHWKVRWENLVPGHWGVGMVPGYPGPGRGGGWGDRRVLPAGSGSNRGGGRAARPSASGGSRRKVPGVSRLGFQSQASANLLGDSGQNELPSLSAVVLPSGDTARSSSKGRREKRVGAHQAGECSLEGRTGASHQTAGLGGGWKPEPPGPGRSGGRGEGCSWELSSPSRRRRGTHGSPGDWELGGARRGVGAGRRGPEAVPSGAANRECSWGVQTAQGQEDETVWAWVGLAGGAQRSGLPGVGQGKAPGLVGRGPAAVDLALPPGGRRAPGKESSPGWVVIRAGRHRGGLCPTRPLWGAGVCVCKFSSRHPSSSLSPRPPGAF